MTKVNGSTEYPAELGGGTFEDAPRGNVCDDPTCEQCEATAVNAAAALLASEIYYTHLQTSFDALNEVCDANVVLAEALETCGLSLNATIEADCVRANLVCDKADALLRAWGVQQKPATPATDAVREAHARLRKVLDRDGVTDDEVWDAAITEATDFVDAETSSIDDLERFARGLLNAARHPGGAR